MIRLLSYLCHHLLPLPHLLLRPPLLRRRWDHQNTTWIVCIWLHLAFTISYPNMYLPSSSMSSWSSSSLVFFVTLLESPLVFIAPLGSSSDSPVWTGYPSKVYKLSEYLSIEFVMRKALDCKLNSISLSYMVTNAGLWCDNPYHASLVNKQFKMQYLVNMRNSCNEYLPSASFSWSSKTPSSSWPSVHGAFVHNEAQNTIRQSWCYKCYVETQTKTIHCISKSIMVMFAGLWCDKPYHYTSLICSSNQPF